MDDTGFVVVVVLLAAALSLALVRWGHTAPQARTGDGDR